MENSTPINWDSLDSLVLDFALQDRLVSPIPNSPNSSSSYRSRVLIRQIRYAVESGDLDAAIEQLRFHVPAVLDDHRILFWLQKQKFIELLRRGTAEDREKAIECLRVALAPCALDAYPEAYEEFKHVLLALLFDKEDQSSPVASEWSERRRFELAGLLSSMLKAHLHAYDPIFSLTLRYLISIHKVFCTRQGVPSPISDLTERLLYEDRDPPAVPQQILYEAPPFDEVDIQALAHAVELTRQGAVDSLKFAKGDLFQAFQNELCRMKLDIPLLDKLVHEYCVYRGIVDGIVKSPPVLGLVHSSSTECSSPNLDCASSRLSDGDISVNDTDIQGVSDALVDTSSMPKNDGEVRFACEISNSLEDCSTSDDKHHENYYRRLRRNRNYTTGQGRRKRWRGRVETLEHNSLTHDSTDGAVIEELEKKDLPTIGRNIEDNKFELILEIRELAYKGMAAKVFEEINLVDPDFFQQNPSLLFQLKQVEFLALVTSGDHAKALEVASTYLGPLAANDLSLLKPLKETLLALLEPGQDATPKGTSLPLLATSLQVAMGRKLGIEEPQLMKIVRETLHTHNEWFKLQMCKDRFEHFLKIDQLKEVDFSMRSTAAKMSLDECSNVSSQITTTSNSKTTEDGSSPQASCGETMCDENAILKVMEFLALPRADAIHLLMQYNGNAEVVIQQIFS